MEGSKGLARLLGAAVLLAVVSACADESGWTLPERRLPLPAGASPELQAALAKVQPPRVELARSLVPRNVEDWKRLRAASASGQAQAIEALIARLGVKVAEVRMAGVTLYRVTPPRIEPRHADHLFLYLHGGAYVLNGGRGGLTEALVIAARLGMPVLSIDYRMPPEHPFPAALDDVVAVWRALVAERPAAKVAIGGTSAGGGLALAAVHRFKALGLPLPGLVYAGTPWSDLTGVGDSYHINEGADHLLVSWPGLLESAARLYAGDHDRADPLLSPVYGDFAGFPPVMLFTGTRDLFLSNTVRVHQKLRAAGVEADLLVFEGVAHGDYLGFRQTPESALAYGELGRFVARHLP